ncbi:TonB-dependent receptor plug domain-containing protein [Halpernia frigidisoli]|uniref:Iron complex outermembrane recepter protein n=1 Tax=Halpernia frigidisoli TaxID=1125876 RepID=A0A1I3D727_9FLAO|nr:TonB-dependent receptor [Halpernia frigidisoli]SFH82560.1 iron complex outermembrane recepter protein [Halpernia frigidisoli]
MITKVSLVSFLSFFAIFSAQQKQSDIDEVYVQGKFLNLPVSKINENITIITKAEIEKSPANSIDELLQLNTGLDIRRRGSNGVQSDVSVRGSSFEQVLILVNGVRMNDSQTGHNTLNIPFDLDSVQQIEIIKGPAAQRYGNNAYAGVINIITKPLAEKSVKISAEGGDYKSYDLGANANIGNEKFSNLFQIHSSASDGYRHNTDYKINNFYYQNNLKIKNGALSLQAGFSEKKFGANGFYSSPKATEQYEETQASIVSISGRQTFDKWDFNSNISWRRGQDLYLFNRYKPQIYRNLHLGNNISGDFNTSYHSGFGVTGLGVALRKEILVSNNLGSRERFVSQLFFEHHFSLLNDKLAISPGISYANYSKEGNFFYPGLDAGFTFNENHKIYGNISKVHRVPTFTDLYYTSGTEQGNADLKPESAVSTEVGYQFKTDNFLAKTSFFTRDSDNLIDWAKDTPDAKWTARNIGKVYLQGVEVEIKQNFSGFFKSYSLGYTYLDNQQKDSDTRLSRYNLENLKHQFVATLENKFLKNFTNVLTYRYNERVNLGSYNLIDEKLNYHFNDFAVYVLINNLTNSKYIETSLVPMPGRWFHVGLSYKIKFSN